MKFNITPNLSIEDSNSEVEKIIKKIRDTQPGTLPNYIDDPSYDWFLATMEITRVEEPTEATLYLIQHFGKVGDAGYMAYILKDVFKNRLELDQIIKLMEHYHTFTNSVGEKGDFHSKCADMVKGLRLGASLIELMKKGIHLTPPPNLN